MTDLRERCADLARPVLELTASIVAAGYSPSTIDDALAAVRDIRKILAGGTDGITNAAYLEWHGHAAALLEAVTTDLERKDARAAREKLSDPKLGLSNLTVGCAGMPGW